MTIPLSSVPMTGLSYESAEDRGDHLGGSFAKGSDTISRQRARSA